MVKMANFILCVFYQFKKMGGKRKKNQETEERGAEGTGEEKDAGDGEAGRGDIQRVGDTERRVGRVATSGPLPPEAWLLIEVGGRVI